jgi:hypothetical protein
LTRRGLRRDHEPVYNLAVDALQDPADQAAADRAVEGRVPVDLGAVAVGSQLDRRAVVPHRYARGHVLDQAPPEGIAEGGLREVSPRDVARALTLMNGYYLLDALGHDPDADAAVALETLWTVWTGTLGMSVSGPDSRSRTEPATGQRSTSPRSPGEDKKP